MENTKAAKKNSDSLTGLPNRNKIQIFLNQYWHTDKKEYSKPLDRLGGHSGVCADREPRKLSNEMDIETVAVSVEKRWWVESTDCSVLPIAALIARSSVWLLSRDLVWSDD